MRTAANVVRFKKPAGPPFGGFSKHQDPSQIGPLKCQDCENVILEHGRLRKRPGIVRLGGTTTVTTGKRVEGVYGSQTQPVSGSPAEFIVKKCSAVTGYTVGTLFFWDSTNGWQATASSPAPTLNGNVPTFHEVGIKGEDAYAHVFMLDGSTHAWKLPLDTSRKAHKVGIPCWTPDPDNGGYTNITKGVDLLPTQSDYDDKNFLLSVYETAAAGNTFVYPKTYEFIWTFCDRTQVPPNNELAEHPGLEGNSFGAVYGVKPGTITVTFDNTVGGYKRDFKLYFHSNSCGHTGELTDFKGFFYTHIRVYARCVTDSETNYMHIGTWGHPDYTLSDDDGVWQAEATSEFEWYIDTADLNPSDEDDKYPDLPAAGDGAYDYAPTRNYVPQEMDYFAAHNGRGYWARNDAPFVHYTDAVGVHTGGSYEAITSEFLPPLDGPISLLAHYQDMLVIGTAHGLWAQTGILASHTNRTAAQGAEIPDIPWALTRIPGTVGAVEQGTGSFVIVDGYLFYIGKNGLERFDGTRTENVSLAIRDLLPSDDAVNYLKDATLAHDPNRHIIYMVVRKNLDETPANSRYAGDDASTTGQVESTIWCYHYRALDPLTGYGEWTRLTNIGVYTKANTYDQRYTAIGMRRPLGDKARLLVGMRVTEATDTYYDDCSVHEESASLHTDTQTKGPSPSTVNITWLWQSGHWDLGLLETRKLFHNLAVHIAEDANSSSATLTLGVQVDEGTLFTESFYEKYSHVDFPVGMAGYDVSVKFAGDSGVATEILGYALEAEVIRS
jgi:hypothetical protein